jgi:hypothetical protein
MFWEITSCKSTDISKKHIAAIFRACCLLLHGFLLALLLNPEDEGEISL